MKPITNLEKAVGGIRATEEYQRIFAQAEEMERVGDYDREKIKEIARYCLPKASVTDNWNYDRRDFEFYLNKVLRKPYLVMVCCNTKDPGVAFESVEKAFETFEEAFDYAEEKWDENKESKDKRFDSLKIVSVVNGMRVNYIYEDYGEEGCEDCSE